MVDLSGSIAERKLDRVRNPVERFCGCNELRRGVRVSATIDREIASGGTSMTLGVALAV
jgi:hypothetical protein